MVTAERDICRRANDRDRRPELVGRICHELALRLQRAAQSGDERVERAGELAQFVGTVRMPDIFHAGERNLRRAPRHVGNRPQPD